MRDWRICFIQIIVLDYDTAGDFRRSGKTAEFFQRICRIRRSDRRGIDRIYILQKKKRGFLENIRHYRTGGWLLWRSFLDASAAFWQAAVTECRQTDRAALCLNILCMRLRIRRCFPYSWFQRDAICSTASCCTYYGDGQEKKRA